MEGYDKTRQPPPVIEISTPSPEADENKGLVDKSVKTECQIDDPNTGETDAKELINVGEHVKTPHKDANAYEIVVDINADTTSFENTSCTQEANENEPLVKSPSVKFDTKDDGSQSTNGIQTVEKAEMSLAIEEAAKDCHATVRVLDVDVKREPHRSPQRAKRPSKVSRSSQKSFSGGRPSVVVSSEEKHGPFHNAIPVMPLPLAIFCCLLNLVAPGFGTLVSAFSLFCGGTSTRMATRTRAVLWNLLTAILQMLTFLVIVGWIWSILWGMNFIQLSVGSKKSVSSPKQKVPYYVRRQSSIGYFPTEQT